MDVSPASSSLPLLPRSLSPFSTGCSPPLLLLFLIGRGPFLIFDGAVLNALVSRLERTEKKPMDW